MKVDEKTVDDILDCLIGDVHQIDLDNDINVDATKQKLWEKGILKEECEHEWRPSTQTISTQSEQCVKCEKVEVIEQKPESALEKPREIKQFMLKDIEQRIELICDNYEQVIFELKNKIKELEKKVEK